MSRLTKLEFINILIVECNKSIALMLNNLRTDDILEPYLVIRLQDARHGLDCVKSYINLREDLSTKLITSPAEFEDPSATKPDGGDNNGKNAG